MSKRYKELITWTDEDIDCLSEQQEIELTLEQRERAIELACEYLNNDDALNERISEIILDAIDDAINDTYYGCK